MSPPAFLSLCLLWRREWVGDVDKWGFQKEKGRLGDCTTVQLEVAQRPSLWQTLGTLPLLLRVVCRPAASASFGSLEKCRRSGPSMGPTESESTL